MSDAMQVHRFREDVFNVPDWNSTHILRPDLLVLASSLMDYGILSPLIVQADGMNVIDGSQRLKVIRGNKHLAEKFLDGIPAKLVDCGTTEAMALHIQLNRGRGALVAHRLSGLIKQLKRSGAFTTEDFNRRFCMKGDELELMLDGSIIKYRKVANHRYSRAWVPIEAPPGTVDKKAVVAERPPNADR
tara:strand:+ start:487 stop:1050 length:564 start_codon:yes stop_codon:yes gene_type:complete